MKIVKKISKQLCEGKHKVSEGLKEKNYNLKFVSKLFFFQNSNETKKNMTKQKTIRLLWNKIYKIF